MSKIRGVFSYEDEKNLSKKQQKIRDQKALEKSMKKRKKKINRQVLCNHIAKNNGKSYWEDMPDTKDHIKRKKCMICGQVCIADESFLNEEAFKLVSEQVATMIYLMKTNKKIRISPEFEKELNTTLKVCKQFKYIIKELPETVSSDKKHKKNKKKKNGKKSINRAKF